VLESILACKPANVEELANCKYFGTEDTVDAVLKDKTFQIGEKLSIRRFEIVEGLISTYIHGGGTIGVVVKGESDASDKEAVKAVLKNVALQIAAMSPKYLDKDSVPADALAAEKEILLAQINNDPANASKPDAIKEKMILGKIGKFYDTNCLLEQEYVKEDKMKVCEYIANEAKALGADVKVTGFIRFEKGEGIEKREDNFAEEIAKLTGNN
jgi:elongation factor Ts